MPQAPPSRSAMKVLANLIGSTAGSSASLPCGMSRRVGSLTPRQPTTDDNPPACNSIGTGQVGRTHHNLDRMPLAEPYPIRNTPPASLLSTSVGAKSPRIKFSENSCYPINRVFLFSPLG